jgi:hypothetical protein
MSVRVLPASFLLGSNSQVEYMVVGDHDWSADEAVQTVKTLMKK